MLERVKIVLVGTTHAGNIGSTARAMKTMGLSQLVLVAPEATIDGKSYALAAGAGDVLNQALVVGHLHEALADCQLVLATSARQRGLDWPVLSPLEMGQHLSEQMGATMNQVALVFGREKCGLTNEELQLADFHVVIDANADYSSLNLAQAVQIVCYEVRNAALKHQEVRRVQADAMAKSIYPEHRALEDFYAHLERSLLASGFIVPHHPGKVMHKLRRLFQRARLEATEVQMLRGILSSVDRLARSNESKADAALVSSTLRNILD